MEMFSNAPQGKVISEWWDWAVGIFIFCEKNIEWAFHFSDWMSTSSLNIQYMV